jgi:YggT family protein
MIGGASLSGIVDAAIRFYMYLLFAWVVLSWFPLREGLLMDVYRVLSSLCEPYVGLFRRFMPVAQVGGGGLDFSPFVALLVLQFVGRGIVVVLAQAGY